ncbi:MAG: ECF transporter S component [Bacilli bacterium]
MRKIINLLVIFVGIPMALLVGYLLFEDSQFEIISIIIALLACTPFFIHFEKKSPDARELVLVAVLIAISVVSRIIFSVIPSFKPVAAFTIIVAMVFGKEMGFMVGALTAVLSNMYFGHGPWTPFQMFAWGIIGFFAGLLFNKASSKNMLMILIYGALSGIVFSLILDIWTSLSVDGTFILKRYLAFVTFSFPIMITYVVSNGLFLLILEKPLVKKLTRIKDKFGLYSLK